MERGQDLKEIQMTNIEARYITNAKSAKERKEKEVKLVYRGTAYVRRSVQVTQ